jgi:hypothetical protein
MITDDFEAIAGDDHVHAFVKKYVPLNHSQFDLSVGQTSIE